MNILLAEEEILLSEEYKQMLIDDIEYELEINLMDGKQHPLYQTEAYLDEKYWDKWKYLWDQYYKIIFNAGFGEYKIQKAWSNVTKPGGGYALHNHPHCDLSLVHYLQVPNDAYGTTLVVDEATHKVGGISGTAILFDSLVYHEMQMVPEKLLEDPKNWRYTIVLDLIRGDKPSSRRIQIYHPSELCN